MPIYMEFEGCPGSVTATGHEKWIELQSCQFGVARHVTNPTGVGENREASAPALSEIVVTKDLDISSTNLVRESLWGDGKLIKIDFCKTDKDKFEPYLQFEMENTLIANYSVSGHGGVAHSQPMESLSLNFTKITYNTFKRDVRNKTTAPDRAMWDLAQGKGA
jgi:type VI secretion system secreted protein Hcp